MPSGLRKLRNFPFMNLNFLIENKSEDDFSSGRIALKSTMPIQFKHYLRFELPRKRAVWSQSRNL